MNDYRIISEAIGQIEVRRARSAHAALEAFWYDNAATRAYFARRSALRVPVYSAHGDTLRAELVAAPEDA